MMQVTGSNLDANLNIILSIRFNPSGLYYSITKNGSVETLNYVPFVGVDKRDRLIFALDNLECSCDVVNVIIDTCDMMLVPEELVKIGQLEGAINALRCNSIAIDETHTPIITHARHGVRALLVVDVDILDVFRERYSDVKFYATILSDILVGHSAIMVTINDVSTSISCAVDGKLLYADVFSSSIEVETVMYYIQSLRERFVKKNICLPVYVSGSRCSEALTALQSTLLDIKSIVELDSSVLSKREYISSYNDLIRLS